MSQSARTANITHMSFADTHKRHSQKV